MKHPTFWISLQKAPAGKYLQGLHFAMRWCVSRQLRQLFNFNQVRIFRQSLLLQRQRQPDVKDTILELCMDVLFLHSIAFIEAAGAGAWEGLATDVMILVILLIIAATTDGPRWKILQFPFWGDRFRSPCHPRRRQLSTAVSRFAFSGKELNPPFPALCRKRYAPLYPQYRAFSFPRPKTTCSKFLSMKRIFAIASQWVKQITFLYSYWEWYLIFKACFSQSNWFTDISVL